MAEIRHVQHLRSKVVEVNGQPKLPSSDTLLYGELAVNYHKGTETISFKNDNNEIVTLQDEVEISSGTPKVNTEIWIDLSDSGVTEVYAKQQIDSMMDAVTSKNDEQDRRLDALEEAISNNIVISNVTPTNDGTELFVDTSNDGGNFEIYTKSQVNALVADLQRQIDELKNN